MKKFDDTWLKLFSHIQFSLQFYYKYQTFILHSAWPSPQTISQNFYYFFLLRIEPKIESRTHEKRKLFNNENRHWAGNIFFSLSLHNKAIFIAKAIFLSIFIGKESKIFFMWRSKLLSWVCKMVKMLWRLLENMK